METVKFNDYVLGVLIYNKDMECFSSKFSWCEEDGEISIECEVGQIEEVITKAHALIDSCNSWLSKAKRFASEKLTKLANDWSESDEGRVITEDEFIKKLKFKLVTIDIEGNFSIYFDDGDMFWGHTVIVSGDVNNGLNDAQMA